MPFRKLSKWWDDKPVDSRKKISSLERPLMDGSIRFGPLLLPPDEGPQHFGAFGTTGSGKTTIIRLLLQSVVPWMVPGSDARALIYDAKQDILSILKGMAPSTRVVTLNPFDERGAAWDIAKDVRSPSVAIEIAFTLIPREHESQPFFSDAARDLLHGVMISFIRRGLEWSFADLVRAVSSPGRLKRILQACPATRDMVSRYFQDKRLLSNILSTIATKMLPFEPLASAWESAKLRVSIEDWVKDDYVLVLGNSETCRNAIDAVNRCIVKRAGDLTLDQTESATRRSWFVFDELSEAGRLSNLVSLCKRGRSKGACVVIGVQSTAGLEAQHLYGKQLTSEILGQIGHRFFGRLECPDTAEWASRLLGDQQVRQFTYSNSSSSQYGQSSGTSVSSSTNEQIVVQRAVLPSQFMAIPPCDQESGLAAYYLSRVTGAFATTIPGKELFQLDLIPRDPKTPDFVPRDVESQYLKPWTKEEAERFAPKPESTGNPPPSKLVRGVRGTSILDDLKDLTS